MNKFWTFIFNILLFFGLMFIADHTAHILFGWSLNGLGYNFVVGFAYAMGYLSNTNSKK
jgi:hypothetical protein